MEGVVKLADTIEKQGRREGERAEVPGAVGGLGARERKEAGSVVRILTLISFNILISKFQVILESPPLLDIWDQFPWRLALWGLGLSKVRNSLVLTEHLLVRSSVI